LNISAGKLIVVGRTCLDSIQELRRTQQNDHEDWRDRMNELRNTQAVTDEKLNILIDTVDRDRGEKG
jgi:predicted metal-binding protein